MRRCCRARATKARVGQRCRRSGLACSGETAARTANGARSTEPDTTLEEDRDNGRSGTEDLPRSLALHRVPLLRGRLPRMRYAQGREHDLHRLPRATRYSGLIANAVYALRGAVGSLRSGVSRAGHPGQPRWRGAIGGRDALHLCENCGYACPFGVPKFNIGGHYMQKCNLCYDRTSQGKGPMCATVCPTQAIFYGTYEEWVRAGRAGQGAKPVNTFSFGRQRVRTRNYVVMRQEDEALDLLSLVAG